MRTGISCRADARDSRKTDRQTLSMTALGIDKV
jgi:hypothetical protein